MRCSIVQYTKQHAECIGLAVEFLLNKYKCNQIDILIYEKDNLGKEWFEFFKINYKGLVKLDKITEINGVYDTMFFLTSSDYFINSGSHNAFGLVHQADKIIDCKEFRNLSICPFIDSCELIPFNFRFMLNKYSKSLFYSDIDFFVTGWQEHLDLHTLNDLLRKQDIKCLYISKRYETHKTYSNLIFCERITTMGLIDCFLHKTCIFIPKMDGVYMNERISGCIHLCYSFGTPLFLPYKCKEKYPECANFIGYDKIYEIL